MRAMDETSGGDQVLAMVTYKYFGIPCGQDSGIATFFNGYLMFEGSRVSFGLKSQDLDIDLRFGMNCHSKNALAPSLEFKFEVEPVDERKAGRLWYLFSHTLESEVRRSTFPPVVRLRSKGELIIESSARFGPVGSAFSWDL
jgi:hypothetical protein